ncbi:hypothetical protein D3C86_1287790 [compost metagenome]
MLQSSDFDGSGNPLVPVLTDAKPGDIKYLDLNKNGIIDADDQTNIGNPNPQLDYFANFRIAYKKINLEFLLQGTGKSNAPLLNEFAFPLDMSGNGGVPTTYYSENYWTPQRTDARFPRISTAPANNRLSSDFWFQNAAYLRVKFIQLGYDLNNSFVKQMGISSIRFYVNAQNPVTFSSLKITDPESRGDEWTYGIMKTYTLGLNVQF